MVDFRPLRDKQDVPYAAVCDRCGKELYEWEVREGWMGETLCPECEEAEFWIENEKSF